MLRRRLPTLDRAALQTAEQVLAVVGHFALRASSAARSASRLVKAGEQAGGMAACTEDEATSSTSRRRKAFMMMELEWWTALSGLWVQPIGARHG